MLYIQNFAFSCTPCRYLAPLLRIEGGADPASGGLIPAIDFKEFDTKITQQRIDNPVEKEILIKGFVWKILEYACAALNARTNLTLYMGVNDEGKVTGIEVESYEQVSLLVPLFQEIHLSIICF